MKKKIALNQKIKCVETQDCSMFQKNEKTSVIKFLK